MKLSVKHWSITEKGGFLSGEKFKYFTKLVLKLSEQDLVLINKHKLANSVLYSNRETRDADYQPYGGALNSMSDYGRAFIHNSMQAPAKKLVEYNMTELTKGVIIFDYDPHILVEIENEIASTCRNLVNYVYDIEEAFPPVTSENGDSIEEIIIPIERDI